MTKEENCIFCKIIANEIPGYKVYEDENFFGFLDINPIIKGHMLLVPKNHSVDAIAMGTDEYQNYMTIGKQLGEKVKNIFGSARVSLMLIGLEVPHTHLHIFPINKIEDTNFENKYEASPEELKEVQELYKF